MTFIDMPYERPDMAAIEQEFKALVRDFETASTAEQQIQTFEQMNAIRFQFMSMESIASIRNSIDTRDEFYKAEKDFFDDVLPRMQALETGLRKVLSDSKFRAELEAKFGAQVFRLADVYSRSFSDQIIEDMQQNNKLVTEYNALVASAKIPFNGEELTLSQLGKYINSSDRATRKAANEARFGFFEEHETEFDDLYDRMVKLRTQMAKKLGYDNFVQMGYDLMGRTDYGQTEAAAFRKQVEAHIVPLSESLRSRQQERIGVDTMHYYDLAFHFTSGNPVPKGDPDWILAGGVKMYEELSPETNRFFSFMTDNALLDLLSREGKRVGGYCTVIPNEKSPFIFANFNGTAHDVTVLTHEAGHAFQVFESRNWPLPEYLFPTSEGAEIHSMSMEFFTWDWMHLFFQEDTEKFKFYHMSSSVTSIPYLVTVDEFQHYVYENPDATPADRKAKWREIERKYLPSRNYAENDYLERGGFWHQQLHIFNYPFYYIDYALAQICALQFWKRMNENREQAWNDYLHLCKLGGSRSFVDLVKAANLISPFADGCVESIIGDIRMWLDGIDDKAL